MDLNRSGQPQFTSKSGGFGHCSKLRHLTGRILFGMSPLWVGFSLLLGVAQAQARVMCGQVHEPYYFTHLSGEPSELARPLRRGEFIKSSSVLVKEAQAALSARDVQTERKGFLYFSRLEISVNGTHPLNRMAAAIHRLSGTRLVYQPKNLVEAEASYGPESNRIYISHRTAHTGALDLPFFHEVRHWALERKSRQEPSLMDMEQSFSSTEGLAINRSGYVGFLNFQEARTYTYEMKLFLKNLQRIQQDIHYGTEIEIGNRVQMIRDVLLDIRDSLSLHRQWLEEGRYRMQFEGEKDLHGNSIYLHRTAGTLRIPLSRTNVMRYQSLGSAADRRNFLESTAQQNLVQAEGVVTEALQHLSQWREKGSLPEMIQIFERLEGILRARYEASVN